VRATGVLDDYRPHTVADNALEELAEAWPCIDGISARDCRVIERLDELVAGVLCEGLDRLALALVAAFALTDVRGRARAQISQSWHPALVCSCHDLARSNKA